MLLSIRQLFIIVFIYITTALSSQVKIDSTRIHYTNDEYDDQSDCFYESADYIIPVIRYHNYSIEKKLNDSIISLFRCYWGFENYALDSIVNSGGSHDLSPAPQESDTSFSCILRSTSTQSHDFNTLLNSRPFLSLNLSFYSENTYVSVSGDQSIHPLLFDMKQKCWINKDSLFLHTIDTIIAVTLDSFQQQDGEQAFFNGVGITNKKIIFYYQRNWPNHSFTDMVEFEPSTLSVYIRPPYRKLLKSLE